MMRKLFDLSGRIALVTGGSKGLGGAMARVYAEAGADVVISSRHENELQAALEPERVGTAVRLSVLRGGEPQELSAPPAERE